MKNERGFTLIEMMIVLLVISVLLIITVPNVTKHNASINSKGCEAFQNMVEGQVQAYIIDEQEPPGSIDILKEKGYIKTTTCPDGTEVYLSEDGEVSVAGEDDTGEDEKPEGV